MDNCYELYWCQESRRYIVVPESNGNVYTGPAPMVRLASSAVADARPSAGTIGVPPHPQTGSQWYSGSQTVDVQGYRIPGMVYVGTNLGAVKGDGIEPALINPYLRVNTPAAFYRKQDLFFPLSYSKLSSQGRGGYLQWLAEGRTDGDVPIEFVFLFFYGLERRLLTEGCPVEEAVELVAEVERLREIYSKNHVFADYSFRLVDFLSAKDLEPLYVDIDQYAAPPVRRLWNQNYASMLRVGLGQCAADGMEVPASWALAWAKSHPGFRERTAAERCRQEYEDLFRTEYEKHFPYGFRPKGGSEKIRFGYQPASTSFAQPIIVHSVLPDVTTFEEPGTTLKNIAMDCLEQLDAYSRYLGRYPDQRQSIAALVLLPEALLQSSLDRVLPDLRIWLETTLQHGIASVDTQTLVENCFGNAMKASLTKREAVVLAEFLERMGIGIEPDPRLGMVISVDVSVTLFRLEQKWPRSLSDSYSAAAMTLSLSAVVWEADKTGKWSQNADFEGEISSGFELSEGEILRLRARRQWIAHTGVQIGPLRKAIGLLSPGTRKAVGDTLLKLVHTAGEISPSKIDALLEVYRVLRLNPEHVYSAIHAYATDPVSLHQTQAHLARCGIHPSSQKAISPTVGIDMDRVQATTAESERVSTLLREIFVEEDQPAGSEIVKTQNVFKLDDRHSEFLKGILGKESWSRADLASLAAQCRVLLEGALDILNDLALDRYGDLLWDGEDPIFLNPMIAKELNNE